MQQRNDSAAILRRNHEAASVRYTLARNRRDEARAAAMLAEREFLDAVRCERATFAAIESFEGSGQ